MQKNTMVSGVVLLAIIASSCSYMPGSKVKCNDEDSIATAIAALKVNVYEKINIEFKDIVKKEEFKDLDRSKLNALINSVTYTLTDTRTDHRDPDSDKVTCTATLTAMIPGDIIKNADISKKIIEQPSAQVRAENADLKFSSSNVVEDMQYVVQPSDDRKKIFVHITDLHKEFIPFLNENVLFALVKPVFENQKAKAAQLSRLNQNSAVNYESSTVAEDSAYAAAEAASAAADAAAAASDAAQATTESYSEYDY